MEDNKKKRIYPERMTDGDLVRVAEIEKLCFSAPWSVESLKLLTNEGIGVGMVCRKDGDVCAYGGMLITVDEGQITNVAVHPDHRRKGYGAAIVRALLRHAKDEKLESVSLEVRASNTAAIELYKRAGFTEAGRRKGFYTKPTEDALVMVCKIK